MYILYLLSEPHTTAQGLWFPVSSFFAACLYITVSPKTWKKNDKETLQITLWFSLDLKTFISQLFFSPFWFYLNVNNCKKYVHYLHLSKAIQSNSHLVLCDFFYFYLAVKSFLYGLYCMNYASIFPANKRRHLWSTTQSNMQMSMIHWLLEAEVGSSLKRLLQSLKVTVGPLFELSLNLEAISYLIACSWLSDRFI